MSYQGGKAFLRSWYDRLTDDEPPPTWSAGESIFDGIEVAPGRIVLIGGAPGAGKTALLGQWTTSMLVNNPDLRVLIANVEMSPFALLYRQLSRLSGVPLTAIRRRLTTDEERARMTTAAGVLFGLSERLAFADEPHRLDAVARAGSDCGADVVVLDYVQRIDPVGKSAGLRERMNGLMSELRRLADKGRIAILAAAAVSRSRDAKGRASYDGEHLSLASLRESGELEFGADDAALIYPTDDTPTAPTRSVLLSHLKSRYGELRDVALTFDRRIQQFTPDPFASMVPPSAVGAIRNGTARGATAHDWTRGR